MGTFEFWGWMLAALAFGYIMGSRDAGQILSGGGVQGRRMGTGERIPPTGGSSTAPPKAER